MAIFIRKYIYFCPKVQCRAQLAPRLTHKLLAAPVIAPPCIIHYPLGHLQSSERLSSLIAIRDMNGLDCALDARTVRQCKLRANTPNYNNTNPASSTTTTTNSPFILPFESTNSHIQYLARFHTSLGQNFCSWRQFTGSSVPIWCAICTSEWPPASYVFITCTLKKSACAND